MSLGDLSVIFVNSLMLEIMSFKYFSIGLFSIITLSFKYIIPFFFEILIIFSFLIILIFLFSKVLKSVRNSSDLVSKEKMNNFNGKCLSIGHANIS